MGEFPGHGLPVTHRLLEREQLPDDHIHWNPTTDNASPRHRARHLRVVEMLPGSNRPQYRERHAHVWAGTERSSPRVTISEGESRKSLIATQQYRFRFPSNPCFIIVDGQGFVFYRNVIMVTVNIIRLSFRISEPSPKFIRFCLYHSKFTSNGLRKNLDIEAKIATIGGNWY